MKRGYIYTIVFIFITSAVFTALLAAANAFYLPVIQKNEELAQKKSLLYVFDIKSGNNESDIVKTFERSIKPESVSGINLYAKYDGSKKVQGYAVPFSGSGLWGTIKGYLAVSSDLKRVLGVDFISHSETPGLGGRIDEPVFKEQFRNLSLEKNKGFTYKSGNELGLDAITGATITSKSVLKILNNLLESDISRLEVN